MTPGDAPMQTTVAANETPAKPPSFPTARNLHMTTNMSTKFRRKHLAQQDAGHACMCPLPLYRRHGTHLRNLKYTVLRSRLHAWSHGLNHQVKRVRVQDLTGREGVEGNR